jgi:hypothetical protein
MGKMVDLMVEMELELPHLVFMDMDAQKLQDILERLMELYMPVEAVDDLALLTIQVIAQLEAQADLVVGVMEEALAKIIVVIMLCLIMVEQILEVEEEADLIIDQEEMVVPV